MTTSLKHILFTSILALSLAGCDSSSDKPTSDHGLIEHNTTTETNTTHDDQNTTSDQDNTDSTDTNGTSGGNDQNGAGGGNDSNNSTGGQDDNGTTGGNDQNNTGGSDNNGSTGGQDSNGTSGGNNQNGTGGSTGGGTDTNTTTLKSLALSIQDTSLNKDHNTTLKVQAAYSDGKSADVTDQVEWVMDTPDALSIRDHTLTALKDRNVTLRAKLNGTLSNPVNLSIYWEVGGHRLPPEPDPAINNATLLGVDVNGNGVRDDVERWIILHYAKDPKYPKTKTAIALQYAWASQKILANPTMESNKFLNNALDCMFYWADNVTNKYAKSLSPFEKGKFRRKLYILSGPTLDDKVYNTKERIKQYFKFNAALSGNIFDGRDRSIKNCRTNINLLGE